VSRGKWLWPLRNPLSYSPQGYALALLWNVSELAGIRLPFAGWAFGVICGVKGKRVK